MKYSILFSCLVLLFACNEHIDNQNQEADFKLKADQADITISEISSTSADKNEFNKKADWIMLHNSSEESVWLNEGDWSISDDPEEPRKFEIPEVCIPAKGNLKIWCDKSKLDGDDIHANFKLSSKGEMVTLYYQESISDRVQYDSTMAKNGTFDRIDQSHEMQLSNISNKR